MKALFSELAVAAMAAAAFLAYVGWAPSVEAISTTTIIGWNFPNGSTLGNGVLAIIFPLAGIGMMDAVPLLMGYRGDFLVTTSLAGMLMGSLFGTLSISTSNATAIPFALIVLSATLLVLWLWRGGGR